MRAARRPRPTRAYGLARRLALGAPVPVVAEAARCDPAWLLELLDTPGFQELLAGWRDLLALDPAQRTRRLEALAHLVLEQALAEGRLGAALLTLTEVKAGRDPVVGLAAGIERALVRPAAEGATAPPAPPPADPPAPAGPAPAGPAAGRDPWRASAGHAAARLRAQIVQEHGQSVVDRPGAPRPDPRADPLGAAIHAGHRAADAAHAAARAAATPAPTRHDRPSQALGDALQAPLARKLAAAGPAGQRVLAQLDGPTLDRLAQALLTRRPDPHSAQPQGP